MGPQELANELIVSGLTEVGPEPRDDGSVFLSGPRLFVRVQPSQVMEHGGVSLFIGTMSATVAPDRPGVEVTAVGVGEDLRSAIGEALAQWVFGTLPVLLHWRGQHDCLTSAPDSLETKGARFEVLSGPLVARGVADGEGPLGGPDHLYWGPLKDALTICKLLPQVHWFELFANKGASGEVEATCRWGNKDWVRGQSVLESVASTWPPTDQPMRSYRQFLMLLPEGGDHETLKAPTLWQRLRSRA